MALREKLGVNELQGNNAWLTNKAITEYGWLEQQDVVLIGRGDQSADALTGNVLASKYGAPILLSKNNELPKPIEEELLRLKPKKVYILGGSLAISSTVEEKIRQVVPTAEVVRIEGNNRYKTSMEIAKEINSPSKSIILAPAYDPSGEKESPDALTVGPYAGINQIPIILTEKDHLRSDIRSYIIDSGIESVYLLGGELVVSKEVEQELGSIVEVERIAGRTRYETATKIAERFPLNNSNVFFSRGDRHIDALSAAPLATREQAPILLTKTNAVPGEVSDWLKDQKNIVKDVYFLGGHLAIDANTRESIRGKLIYPTNADGTLKSFNETVTITTNQLRSAIGGTIMKSTLLDSDKPNSSYGSIIVSGHGYGHGVGMSQYGALYRAKEGHTYREILQFYYPGTDVSVR